MTGYIIGLILGIIVIIWQNLKPTSAGFRYMFLIVSAALMWGIYYAHIGWWNVLVIPLGVNILCFISAFCFPYKGISARQEYMHANGRNYYAELKDDDQIGEIHAPAFKQTYDRIMEGIITEVVITPDDLKKLLNLLYSKNFYPISIHTKQEIMQHINNAVYKVARESRFGDTIPMKAKENIELIFNTYVSVMSIHEDATKRIEELRAMQEDNNTKESL